jgi:hypothetical protein
MSLLSGLGKGLVRWTPKIAEASADDIVRFGPQAARVKALLNFIPGMSDDAAAISRDAWDTSIYSASDKAYDAAMDAERYTPWNSIKYEPYNAASSTYGALDAKRAEIVSDLITPETYRTLTNPLASARALDRLAGRAPESFVPTARDMGERGLVSAPADIVTALRISKLPPQQQSLVMGLVDSGMTIEEAMQAARALS